MQQFNVILCHTMVSYIWYGFKETNSGPYLNTLTLEPLSMGLVQMCKQFGDHGFQESTTIGVYYFILLFFLYIYIFILVRNQSSSCSSMALKVCMVSCKEWP
ncbi:hypothetical protein JHK87_042202 [Glycine soja]|nr:hypothetical protein JHK87_042202 [Glycine soja]